MYQFQGKKKELSRVIILMLNDCVKEVAGTAASNLLVSVFLRLISNLDSSVTHRDAVTMAFQSDEDGSW